MTEHSGRTLMGFAGQPPQTTPRLCGAKRSRGRGTCRSPVLGPTGRCRCHSGWGLGPTSEAGKRRALEALSRINAARAANKPEARIAAMAAAGASVSTIVERLGIPRDQVRAVVLAVVSSRG
jgi:hypothetical protein